MTIVCIEGGLTSLWTVYSPNGSEMVKSEVKIRNFHLKTKSCPFEVHLFQLLRHNLYFEGVVAGKSASSLQTTGDCDSRLLTTVYK